MKEQWTLTRRSAMRWNGLSNLNSSMCLPPHLPACKLLLNIWNHKSKLSKVSSKVCSNLGSHPFMGFSISVAWLKTNTQSVMIHLKHCMKLSGHKGQTHCGYSSSKTVFKLKNYSSSLTWDILEFLFPWGFSFSYLDCIYGCWGNSEVVS